MTREPPNWLLQPMGSATEANDASVSADLSGTTVTKSSKIASSSSSSSSESNCDCHSSEAVAQHTQQALHSAVTCHTASAASSDDSSDTSSSESVETTPSSQANRLNLLTSAECRAIPAMAAASISSASERGLVHIDNSSSSADSSKASSDDTSSDSGSPSDTIPPVDPEQQYCDLDTFFAARAAASTRGRGIAPPGMPRSPIPRGAGGRGGHGRSGRDTLGREARAGVLRLLRDKSNAVSANYICTSGQYAPGQAVQSSLPRAAVSVAKKGETSGAGVASPVGRSSFQLLQGSPRSKATGGTIAMQHTTESCSNYYSLRSAECHQSIISQVVHSILSLNSASFVCRANCTSGPASLAVVTSEQVFW